ncbi:CDP-alcohol phosphatidyltransferase family protein [Sphingorhabdus sp. EL138]|jgi:phosphatidylglycerophosphate synthase|uniref:CDP-alcohol phosphatidyltransferase family protein n=1 Tax=Sphingorhabdus sp. EL138 TaxID=2073156 RepID=UPI0025FF18A1|nr:CDP-alcohol phosphatidyltransferase family protein [Sphingorhabdus sp. EL138]
MFDVALRRFVDPALNRIAAGVVDARISANMLTISGAGLALAAAFFITQSNFAAALGLILLNRIVDGLDGAVARIKGPTEFGGYLDTICDYIFYLSIPVAFGLMDQFNQIPALLLVASFTLTAVSFLAFAAIAARQVSDDGAHGPKAFIYSTGLMEGAETIAFFALFCLFPSFFPTLAIIFAALCLLTVLQRFILAAKSFG